jgi:flagellar protein FlbD
MINLTRINRAPVVLNSDLIEYIERTPDTVVSLTNGLKLLVLESPSEIVSRVIDFRRHILENLSGGISLALATSLPASSACRPPSDARQGKDED